MISLAAIHWRERSYWRYMLRETQTYIAAVRHALGVKDAFELSDALDELLPAIQHAQRTLNTLEERMTAHLPDAGICWESPSEADLSRWPITVGTVYLADGPKVRCDAWRKNALHHPVPCNWDISSAENLTQLRANLRAHVTSITHIKNPVHRCCAKDHRKE